MELPKSLHKKGFAVVNLYSQPLSDRPKKGRENFIRWFDEDNHFPDTLLIGLIESLTLNAAIQNIITYVKGNGVEVYQNGVLVDITATPLEKVNGEGESIIDIYSNIATDFVIYGNACLRIKTREIFDKKTTGLFHENPKYFRFKKPEINGEVDYIIKKASWDDARGEEEVFPLDVYDNPSYDGGIYWIKEYNPLVQYYGIPYWYTKAVQAWAKIEEQIPTYNGDRISNSFLPSGALDVFGGVPDGYDTAEDYLLAIKEGFTGEKSNGKILIQLLQDATQATKWTPFTNEPQGIYLDLQKLITENIFRGANIHPSLMVETAGKVGGGQEIETLVKIFNNTIIKKFQNQLTKAFNKIIQNEIGLPNTSIKIIPFNPLS